MMKLAIPKGRLLAEVREILNSAGLSLAFRNDRDYSPKTNGRPDVTARLFKPRAIPQLLALGRYDLGFCGLDLVHEAQYDTVVPLIDLGLNRVSVVAAVPRATPHLLKLPPRRPIVIATEYPRIADTWALKHGLAHITLHTWGSTEAYAPDDADVVIDCVETGATMEANGLVIVERIMESSTWAVAAKNGLDGPNQDTLREFIADLKEVVS